MRQKQLSPMRTANLIDPKYHYALAQVFSPSLLKKIHDPAAENNIRDMLHHCGLYTGDKWNFMMGLEATYNYLKENYRCEYVYKNEIANQLLLRFHNDNSATLLKEVASDCSIADIIIINGNTVAYEIKTELDSFERLPSQLESYQMLYDELYIVTHPGVIDALSKKIDEAIGIIVLSNDGKLQTVRKAGSCSHKFNPFKAVFTLRQSELVVAYEKHVGKFPEMGTALIYDFCYQWYVKLDKEDSHLIFYEALKSRKPSAHQFELISNCNPSLKMLFLGKELSKKYCNSTINRLGIFV